MKVSKMHLKPVTASNWKACAGLELDSGQEIFLPGNLCSIAESQFYEHAKSGCASRGSKEIPLLHEILFDKSILTFIIRISGESTEQDVINCS